jgi:hypothetical protein
MQARLALTRFPSTLFAVIFAVIAALILGGALGYSLKPTVSIPGRTQFIPVYAQNGTAPSDDACIWAKGKKAC